MRPHNPPYIHVRVQHLAPGDVINPAAQWRGGIGGCGAIAEAGPMHTRFKFDVALWRDLILDDGRVVYVGNLETVMVWGGPKFDQRNDPGVVRWIGGEARRFMWEGGGA
jgi:hypothetical protein